MKYIILAQVRRLLNSHTKIAELKCWKSNGEIIVYRDVICTSSNHRNNSFNLKLLTSGEIRKVKAICIFEINQQEVII